MNYQQRQTIPVDSDEELRRLNAHWTAVQQRPQHIQAKPARPRGISRSYLRRNRTNVERVIAWIVLVLGLFGSLIASQGGWEKVAARQWSASAAVAVLALQIFLTWVQWSYSDRPWRAYPARIVDACLTLGGWGPLLIGVMSGLVGSVLSIAEQMTGRVASPMADVVGGWLILIIAAFGVAWYPETTLLDD